MKNLDALIEALKKTKEDLTKTPNMAAGAPTNGTMKAEGVTTRIGPKFVASKDVGNGRMVLGEKPSPQEVENKLQEMTAKNDNQQPPPITPEKKKAPMQAKWPEDQGDFEKCTIAKNGQWEIKEMKKDSADPKWAPKDRKIKDLQTKIDSGTYKPDAGKIADKMINPPKPLKKEEMSSEANNKLLQERMMHGLKKTEEIVEELIKVAPFKVNERAAKLAGTGKPIHPRHKEQALRELQSEAATAKRSAPAEAKPDHTKMTVTHITSHEAPGQGHKYKLTHHWPDGSKTHSEKPVKGVDARVRNPNMSHAIHLKGHAEPVHTDEKTAHAALKAGHFNLAAHKD